MSDTKEAAHINRNIFTRHPHTIGETYFEHLGFASLCGFKMILAGISCMIHSIFPFLFITTASRTLTDLNQKITTRKNQKLHDFH